MRLSSAVSVRLRAAVAAAGELERWLLPGACLVCAEASDAGDEDPLVCGLCRSRWIRVPDPVCQRCGQPANPIAECRICREWPEGFGLVRSAVWLDDRARRAVHRLKYDG
ncbi:MAG: double zinc ribbon domain-containing protein, partial [Gemmatimonadota bacterium]